MIKTENECVSCGKPCLGTACPYMNVTRFYCDECGSEETLYDVDGDQLCLDCLLKNFEIIEGSNY